MLQLAPPCPPAPTSAPTPTFFLKDCVIPAPGHLSSLPLSAPNANFHPGAQRWGPGTGPAKATQGYLPSLIQPPCGRLPSWLCWAWPAATSCKEPRPPAGAWANAWAPFGNQLHLLASYVIPKSLRKLRDLHRCR